MQTAVDHPGGVQNRAVAEQSALVFAARYALQLPAAQSSPFAQALSHEPQ